MRTMILERANPLLGPEQYDRLAKQGDAQRSVAEIARPARDVPVVVYEHSPFHHQWTIGRPATGLRKLGIVVARRPPR